MPKELKVKKLDSSTIMIGFTGPPGSGCSYISEYIPKLAKEKTYRYFKLSSIIEEVLKTEGKDKPSTEEKQNKGNELRKERGGNILVELLLNKIETQWDKKKDYGIIIDGIKNAKEVETLKRFPNFYLISVQALTETRRKRVVDNIRFKTIEEFDKADRRDKLEPNEWGQQVSTCSDLSDIVIYNEKEIPPTSDIQKETFIRDIYNKYIKLIEYAHEGITPLDMKPTTDELGMTIAYTLSKSSSCLKRKVGAVIIDLESRVELNESENIQKEMPYIVSSGYNEVPFGQVPCKYHPDYKTCYRDYLKQEFAKEIIHCPVCGQQIKLDKIVCPSCRKEHDHYVKSCTNCYKEIDYNFTCSKCNEDIFNFFIPGSKKSPGKLMDMCRALHAEEMTLLRLQKGDSKINKNLVLYVTTQPCNLCANKIVQSGITKVVYSEPYSMKESQDILDNGKVNTDRFKGVKSSAFFRLYK